MTKVAQCLSSGSREVDFGFVLTSVTVLRAGGRMQGNSVHHDTQPVFGWLLCQLPMAEQQVTLKA